MLTFFSQISKSSLGPLARGAVALMIAGGFILTGCASSPEKVQRRVAEVQKTVPNAVVDNGEVNVLTRVDFAQGSSELTEESKKQVSTALAQARTVGTISEVKILSWSDMAYPTDSRDRQPLIQRRLAEERAIKINEYLRTINRGDDDVDVLTYNMAKRPGPLSRLFRTSDLKVKNAIERGDMNSAKAGRASTAIVIFSLDDSVKEIEMQSGL